MIWISTLTAFPFASRDVNVEDLPYVLWIAFPRTVHEGAHLLHTFGSLAFHSMMALQVTLIHPLEADGLLASLQNIWMPILLHVLCTLAALVWDDHARHVRAQFWMSELHFMFFFAIWAASPFRTWDCFMRGD